MSCQPLAISFSMCFFVCVVGINNLTHIASDLTKLAIKQNLYLCTKSQIASITDHTLCVSGFFPYYGNNHLHSSQTKNKKIDKHKIPYFLSDLGVWDPQAV